MRQNFSDILKRHTDIEMSKVHTALPGQFEDYDSTTRKATVKPLIQTVFANGEVLPLQPISNVPVVFPSTVNAGIVFPISKDDGCLILFSERSMERWLSEGGDSEPLDKRKFSLTDAIAIPGLFNFKNTPDFGDNESLQIKYKNAIIQIDDDGTINITGDITIKLNGGGERAARENDATLSNSSTDSSFWTFLSSIVTTFNAHTHASSGAPPVPLLGAAPTSQTGKINEGSDSVEIGD